MSERSTGDPASRVLIERQDYAKRGRYVGTIPGEHGIARLEYRRERDDLLIAEHTETSESFQRKGVAEALVQRMVEDARAEGFKIYALCTYVDDQRRRHPEWSDVFRTFG